MTSATRALWIGTYPHPASGGAEGVWRVELDAAHGSFVGGSLAATSPSPSFLALAGDTLYAVGEEERGTVSAFAVGPDGGLSPRGDAVATGGAFPCHVVARGEDVLVANYGDGILTIVPSADDGALTAGARHQPHQGSGTDAARQEGPHAHFVAPLAGLGAADDGSGDVLVVDLGTDELRRHSPGAPDGTPARVVATFPAGTGPRHLVALPSGHLVVVGELDPALFVLAPVRAADGGTTYEVVARHEVARTSAPDGSAGFPSHVAVSADGTRVLAAVRGPDVLAVHAVDPGAHGAAPTLRHLGDSSVGGAWPRHFAVLGVDPASTPDHDLVVVANQEDDRGAASGDGPTSNLTLLRVARADGAGEVLDVLALPAPACVVEA